MEISEFDRFCVFYRFCVFERFLHNVSRSLTPQNCMACAWPILHSFTTAAFRFWSKVNAISMLFAGRKLNALGKDVLLMNTHLVARSLKFKKAYARGFRFCYQKFWFFYIFILNLSRLPLYPPGCMSRARSPRLFKIRHVSTDFPELSIDMVFEGYFVFSELCSDYNLWTMTCDFFFNLFAWFVILCLCSPYYTPGVEIIQGL